METTEQGDAVVLTAIREVVNGATAGQVLGTPITQDGTVVLPVAKVAGGAGGGAGHGPTERGSFPAVSSSRWPRSSSARSSRHGA